MTKQCPARHGGNRGVAALLSLRRPTGLLRTVGVVLAWRCLLATSMGFGVDGHEGVTGWAFDLLQTADRDGVPICRVPGSDLAAFRQTATMGSNEPDTAGTVTPSNVSSYLAVLALRLDVSVATVSLQMAVPEQVSALNSCDHYYDPRARVALRTDFADSIDGQGYNCLTGLLFYLIGGAGPGNPTVGTDRTGALPSLCSLELEPDDAREVGPAVARLLGDAFHYLADIHSPGHTDFNSWIPPWVPMLPHSNPGHFLPFFGSNWHSKFDSVGDSLFRSPSDLSLLDFGNYLGAFRESQAAFAIRRQSPDVLPQLIYRYNGYTPHPVDLRPLRHISMAAPTDLVEFFHDSSCVASAHWSEFEHRGAFEGEGVGSFARFCEVAAVDLELAARGCAGLVDWLFAAAAAQSRQAAEIAGRDAPNFLGVARAMQAVTVSNVEPWTVTGQLRGADQDDFFPVHLTAGQAYASVNAKSLRCDVLDATGAAKPIGADGSFLVETETTLYVRVYSPPGPLLDQSYVLTVGAGTLRLVRYVDSDAAGADNGTSWKDAFRALQAGIDAVAAAGGGEVWVAEGTYRELRNGIGAVVLRPRVAVYGGFAGTETVLSQRDWRTRETCVDGATARGGSAACHVVLGDDDAILDGFTITGGDACSPGVDDSGGGMMNLACSPTVRNCIFRGNQAFYSGGGMYNEGASPVVLNCQFQGNSAGAGGGGMACFDGSAPVLTNCTFVGNTADEGGALRTDGSPGSAPVLTNCTLTCNTARMFGGAILAPAESVLSNCILWGNLAPRSLAAGHEVYGGAVSTLFHHCTIEDGVNGAGFQPPDAPCTDGGGNLALDPVFGRVPSAGADGTWGTLDDDCGDLRPQLRSPCVDAGDTSAVPEGVDTDLAGADRVQGAAVDIGALEGGSSGAPRVIAMAPAPSSLSGPVSAVTITFDRPLAAATVVPSHFTVTGIALTGTGSWLVPGQVAYDPASLTVTFTAGAPLGPGRYGLLISPAVCGVTGLALDGEFPADGTAFSLPSGDGTPGGAFSAWWVIPTRLAWFVDRDATGAGNGTSWRDAFRTVQPGIDAAAAPGGGQVWVAEGVYGEGRSGAGALVLKSGVEVYGGFKGGPDGETELSQRDWKGHVTIVDGSKAYGGSPAFHVVLGADRCRLDGLTISGGDSSASTNYGDGSKAGGGMRNAGVSPTVVNCVFENNTAHWGGAVVNSDASPQFVGCTFRHNTAGLYAVQDGTGGTLYLDCQFLDNASGGLLIYDYGEAGGAEGTAPRIVNCLFARNTRDYGLYAECRDDTQVINCTVTANANGIGCEELIIDIVNCVVWGNLDKQVYVAPDTGVNLQFCDVQGGCPEDADGLDLDPLFVDAANGDFRLQAGSPCLDAGNTRFVPAGVTTDLAGRPRLDGAAVDIGAYEADQGVSVWAVDLLRGGWDELADGALVQPGEGILIRAHTLNQTGTLDVEASFSSNDVPLVLIPDGGGFAYEATWLPASPGTAADGRVTVTVTPRARPDAPPGRGFQRWVTLAAPTPAPDLIGEFFRSVASPTGWNQSVPIQCRIANVGATDAGPSVARLYLSKSPFIDPADELRAEVLVPALAAGAAATLVPVVPLPVTAPPGFPESGPFWLGVIVNATGTVPEDFRNNNANRGEGFDEVRFGFAPVDGRGPRVLACSPLTALGSIAWVDVFFDEAINPDTFSWDDVALTGPGGGQIPIDTPVPQDSMTFRIGFLPQNTVGDYRVVIGPWIMDVTGNPMNQNQDATNGDGERDQFATTFTVLENAPPYITGMTVEKDGIKPVGYVDVTFSEPMLPATFTVADVSVIGYDSRTPQDYAATGVAPLGTDNRQFRITLRSASGQLLDRVQAYELRIGPELADANGNAMDQRAGGGSEAAFVRRFAVCAAYADSLPDLSGEEPGARTLRRALERAVRQAFAPYGVTPSMAELVPLIRKLPLPSGPGPWDASQDNTFYVQLAASAAVGVDAGLSCQLPLPVTPTLGVGLATDLAFIEGGIQFASVYSGGAHSYSVSAGFAATILPLGLVTGNVSAERFIELSPDAQTVTLGITFGFDLTSAIAIELSAGLEGDLVVAEIEAGIALYRELSAGVDIPISLSVTVPAAAFAARFGGGDLETAIADCLGSSVVSSLIDANLSGLAAAAPFFFSLDIADAIDLSVALETDVTHELGISLGLGAGFGITSGVEIGGGVDLGFALSGGWSAAAPLLRAEIHFPLSGTAVTACGDGTRNGGFDGGLHGWSAPTGNVTTADDGTGANPVAVLAQPPSECLQTVVFPSDVESLQFDYAFQPPAYRTSLAVLVGSQVVWVQPGTESRGSMLPSGPIDVRAYAGQTQTLRFVLWAVGNPDARVWIDNVQTNHRLRESVGPRVVDVEVANGPPYRHARTVRLTFDEELNVASLALPGAVRLRTGPAEIAPSRVQRERPQVYRVDFPASGMTGWYTLSVGPTVEDLFGNALNQDADAVNGEDADDVFRFSFMVENAPPVAFDQSVTTGAAACRITLTATDLNDDPLSYRVLTPPVCGVLTPDPGTANDAVWTYTPLAALLARDSFTFAANDGTCDSNAATVTVEIRPALPSGVLCVDARSTGVADGSSWERAFPELQPAIDAAQSGQEIWVAAGTYVPARDPGGNPTPADPRTKTFRLKAWTAIYGGFRGIESRRDQRDWRHHASIVSGDLGVAGDRSDNAYHVVTGTGAADTVLDGVIVVDGNANGTSPNSVGGGMYNVSCSPTVANCGFRGNSAAWRAGGVYNEDASPRLVNCWFAANSAPTGQGGAGCDVASSAPVLINCVFTQNTAAYGGATYVCNGASSSLINCTFLGNSARRGNSLYNENCPCSAVNSIFWPLPGGNGAEIANSGSPLARVTHSCISGGYLGAGNRQTDPLFVDSLGDLRLCPGSPCLDSGSNAALPDEVLTDIAGSPRLQNQIVDMGAYEGTAALGAIAGRVTYPGAQHGVVLVQAFDNQAWTGPPVRQAAVVHRRDWSYHLDGLRPGSYFVRAFLDPDDDGQLDSTEAWGAYPANPLVLADQELTGVDLALCDPPAVVSHPVDAIRETGESVTFSVTATGGAPLGYQWQKGDMDLPGMGERELTLSPLTLADAATYRCVVSNPAGRAASNGAVLTVVPPLLIQEVTPGPAQGLGTSAATVTAPVAVAENGALAFSVTAAGGLPPYRYSWCFGEWQIGTGSGVVFTPGHGVVRHPDTTANAVVRCVATDGRGRAVASVEWTGVEICDSNRLPTIGAIVASLAPAGAGRPVTSDDVTCLLDGPAADADAEDVPLLRYRYVWTTEAGVVLRDALTDLRTDELSADLTVVGDRITCTVTAVDPMDAVSPDAARAQTSIVPGGGEWWEFTLWLTNAPTDCVSLGMADGATSGVDERLDLVSIGEPSDASRVHFLCGETKLVRDLRAGDSAATWILEVQAGASDLGLSWDPDLVPRLGLYLTDAGDAGPGRDGQSVYLTLNRAGAFSVPAGASRRLRVDYGSVTTECVLQPGWNLVSVPFEPFKSTVEDVFGAGRSGPVWEWVGDHYSRAQVVRPGTAYWVYGRPAQPPGTDPAASTVTGNCVEAPANQAALDTGWHLVGPVDVPPFAGVALPLTADPPASVSEAVWTWDRSSYRPVTDRMQCGRGYWVLVGRAGTVSLGRPR